MTEEILSVREKLTRELERFYERDFLKAAMAVCALAGRADGEVSLVERYAVDSALESEPALRLFDARKAISILNDYDHALQTEPGRARAVLWDKIGRAAGRPKQARTLMRVAWLIISADDDVTEAERVTFERICGALKLDEEEVLVPMGAQPA